MKFLHTADIHLDSPMSGLAALDAERGADLARVRATCTRQAFSNLIDLAIAENVAFMLIAGDLYDDALKDYGVALFFAHEMRRLARPCFVIHGNHDSLSSVTRTLDPPPNVTVFGSRRPTTVERPDLGIAVHGQSFPARAVPEDLATTYPSPAPGLFNIGLLHSSVEAPDGEHRTYAPCRLETLVNKGYDYWALGHIHTRATLHDQHPVVHFPGNPQGRHIRETGSRGATMVEVQGTTITLSHRAHDVLRFAAVPVDASGVASWDELALRLRLAFAEARDAAEGRPLILRATLTGQTALHGELIADPAKLTAACQDAASTAGADLHLEKAVALTEAPVATDLDPLKAAFREALTKPGLMDTLLKDFAKLHAGLPDQARAGIPLTAEAVTALQDDAWHVMRQALAGRAP